MSSLPPFHDRPSEPRLARETAGVVRVLGRAGGRGPDRAAGRLAGTVVMATTLAAILAGGFGDRAGHALGRAAHGEAVAAVMAAMALELIAVPADPAVRPEPLVGSIDEPRSVVAPVSVVRLATPGERLGLLRLTLPPPSAGIGSPRLG